MTGIITATYGNRYIVKEWEGDRRRGKMVKRWEYSAKRYVVKLDSGEEVFVPVGSITAWLND